MRVELYHRQECPYSAKVRKFISKHQLEPSIEYHDIDSEEESFDELIAMNGDEQVPCLVVDGEPILESEEIIEWLQKNEEKLH